MFTETCNVLKDCVLLFRLYFILKVYTGNVIYVVLLIFSSGEGFLNRRDVATSQSPLADSCSCGGNGGREKR